MAKKHKIIIYGLSLALAIAAYLLLAHFFIFYRIKTAGLIAPDRQDIYVIGADKTMAKNLLYVALGDSLTAGAGVFKYEESYPYLLTRSLAGGKAVGASLKNFSYPGAKTSDLIKGLLAPAVEAQPDLVTLLIGTNDIFGGVSRAVFKKNYQYILERLTKKTQAKIYLINLPHLGTPKLLLTPYDYYYAWRTDQFNKIIRELAEKYNLNYIDLDRSTRAEFKKDRLLYAKDLFHPSAAGYKLWARIIYDDINK
ncbi:MAG: SGNH/GDSL hydrolase family protein [bacterium]|nr:SGNH/GDSL hydrolase family protein [bacterium]